MLEDTDILFTTGSLVSWSSLGPQNNNNFNAVSAVPAEFVRVVNYSKMISFFGAVLYMIPLMVYNNPPRRSAVRDVLHTGLGRVSILLVLVFNIYTYLVVGVSGNLLSKKRSFTYLEEISRIQGLKDLGAFWLSETKQYYLEDIVAGVMVIGTLYMLVLHREYTLSPLPVGLILVRNIIRVHETGYHAGYVFLGL